MDGLILSRYLTLFHLKSLSTTDFSRLLTYFNNIEKICSATDAELRLLNLSQHQIRAIRSDPVKSLNLQAIEKDKQWASQPDNHIVCYEDEDYPPLLKQISRPPPLLYVQGNPQVLTLPHMAVVGSRAASSSGRRNAMWIARDLSAHGLSVVSGLAAGIDTQAHLGAMAGIGITVAVLGTGVDNIYPRLNQELAQRIRQLGAIVSEFPLGAKPLAQHFPRRNRIISGMSLGVLVVEAALRSGSLITARLAMEQDREVFACPGAISNIMTRGCHKLIRDGAKLVENCADILAELKPAFDDPLWRGRLQDSAELDRLSRKDRLNPESFNRQESLVLELIGDDSCHMDVLLITSKLELAQLNGILLGLESKGAISLQAGRYSRQ